MKKLIVTIKNIISMLAQDFINFIHLFDGYSDDPKINQYAKTLRSESIVTMENFISPEQADELRKKVETVIGSHSKTTTLPSGTVIRFRGQDKEGASDGGMIDVFYLDKELKEVADIDMSFIQKIVETTTKQRVEHFRRNAYVNKEILNTRGYHIDSTQPIVFKAFIYLTDVTDTSFGPYSLIKGSHRFSPYVYINFLRNLFIKKNNSTDMPLHNSKKAYHAVGKKGTLILSNQNAIHRGLPQHPGKTRMALVFNFMVISKLSYLHQSAKDDLKQLRMVDKKQVAPAM